MASTPEKRAQRRKPKQQRSRTTVDWIKQAALEIGEREGFQAVTTVRIAERAGVSVGSLYQYFATREAILLALYEDTSVRFGTAMTRMIGQLLQMPLDEAVRYGAKRIFAGYAENKLILLDLVDAMPELHLDQHPISYENVARGAVRAFVASSIGSSSPAIIDRAVFFTERVIMDSVRAYLRAPPPRLTRRALIDDIALILTGYLKSWAAREGERRTHAPPA